MVICVAAAAKVVQWLETAKKKRKRKIGNKQFNKLEPAFDRFDPIV